MIEVSDSVLIDRPVDVVFEYVADQTKAPEGQDGLVEVDRTTDGPVGVGTRHTAVRTFLGRRLELTNEYVRFEPGREIAFTAAAGPGRMEVSYRTEPEAGGTRLSCTMRMEQKGLFRLADPLVARSLRRDFASNFANLKALLEGDPR